MVGLEDSRNMTFHCFGQTERRFSRNSHPSSWIKLMRTKQNKLQVRKVVVPSIHFMAHFLNQLWIYFCLFRFIAPPASQASCRGTPYRPTHVRSPAAAGWLRYLFCLYLKSHTHVPTTHTYCINLEYFVHFCQTVKVVRKLCHYV